MLIFAMNLLDDLDTRNIAGLIERAQHVSSISVQQTLQKSAFSLEDLSILLSPAADGLLEQLAHKAHQLTVHHFGRTMRLYAPLYLSNECINACPYCGFSRDNTFPRTTCTPQEIESNALVLHQQGIRHLLLVSGEQPHRVSIPYITDILQKLQPLFPYICLEIGPYDLHAFRLFNSYGAAGMCLYQETYDQTLYKTLHTDGSKQSYEKRLSALDAAGHAGMRQLGIGSLLGLGDWRTETIALIIHGRYIMKKFWKAQLSVSVPRLRPAEGQFSIPHPVSDRELTHMICVLRLALPQAHIALSTRESAAIRNGLSAIAITMMSAGSCTEPGGYTNPGNQLPQFCIDDNRSIHDIAQFLIDQHYDPVWKDWEDMFHENHYRERHTS